MTRSQLFAEIHSCLLLAVPLAGAQMAQAATAFVDTVMMGILGSQTIAAGGLGATTFNVLLLIATGILAAVSPLVAQAYGAGKTADVGRAVAQGLWLALLLAIPATLFLWHGDAFLARMGQAPENVQLAQRYLRTIAWGFLPGLGFAVLRNFVTALSQPRPVIVIMVCGTLLNAVGNYALMLGKWGLPELGLAGIGLASTLSLWTVFIGLSLYILVQPRLRAYQVFRHLRQLDGTMFQEVVQTGLPIGILVAVETGLFAITTFLMGHLGTVTLAAHQIALQTAAVTFTIALGISYATTVRVGQQFGQGNLAGTRLAGQVGISIAGGFMALMSLLFWVMPTPLVSLYLDVNNPANAAVVVMAKKLFFVAAMFQIVDGVQSAAGGALRGLKDTRIPMLIGIFAYWGVGLTSGYWLGLRLGLGGVGLWWGLALGLTVAAVVLTWRFNTARLQAKSDLR